MGRARTFDDQDILERATRLFWRQGYKGTSMSDLVAATGLAKASIYNAFGTKEDLFSAVLTYYIEKKQSQSLAFLESGQTGRDGLIAYFNNVLRVTEQNRLTPGCLLVNTVTEQSLDDEALCQIVNMGIDRTETHFVKCVKRGIQDGSIDKRVDADTAGLCLVSVLLAIRVLAKKGIETERVGRLISANLDAHVPASRIYQPN